MSRIGVAEVQRDVDDPSIGVVEQPERGVESCAGGHSRERQPLRVQAALERPRAHSALLGDQMDVGIAVGGQGGHELLHGRADVGDLRDHGAYQLYLSGHSRRFSYRWAAKLVKPIARSLGTMNVVLMLAIPVTKATLGVLFFMHVRYSSCLTWVVVPGGFAWRLVAEAI